MTPTASRGSSAIAPSLLPPGKPTIKYWGLPDPETEALDPPRPLSRHPVRFPGPGLSPAEWDALAADTIVALAGLALGRERARAACSWRSATRVPPPPTLLPALLPLMEHLPPRKGRHGMREAVLAWAGRHAPALDALDRCGDEDRCPACENREPCPLDTWRQPLARLAVGDLGKRARSFLRPNGKKAGTGAYTTWIRRGLDRPLADEALALVVQHWRDEDQQSWADMVAQYGWDAGCLHPDITEAVAVIRAAPGAPGDLKTAVKMIDTALTTADGSTAPGWTRLEARRAQLAGLLRRAKSGRPTGEFDADGNPIYATPHHPIKPRRRRRPRFVEVSDGNP